MKYGKKCKDKSEEEKSEGRMGKVKGLIKDLERTKTKLRMHLHFYVNAMFTRQKKKGYHVLSTHNIIE